jgi:signal transduction histidine kinase
MVNRPAGDPQPPSGDGRPRPRDPFARWPQAANAVLAAAIYVACVFVVEGPGETLAFRSIGEVPIGAFFVLGAACASLVWRRRRPLPVLAVTVIATSVASVLDYSDLIGLTMLIALYGTGRYVADDRWSYIGLGGALALTLGTGFIDDSTAAELAFGLVFLSMIWSIGRRMRFRGERVAQLARERAAEARRMVAEERTRIARELHDVVAHRVSLMTVQAGAARTVVADDPEGALRAMEAVETAGRQVLGELRHLLGILRPEDEANGLGPQPRLAEVPRLVDQFIEAGLDVTLAMEGKRTELPALVDLSAYRIVQESLTNVLKHGGPGTRSEVRIRTDKDGVAIEVLDNGRGASILPGSGHGIIGMRERAELMGGSLDTGPRRAGGFQVTAYLPIGERTV